MIGKRVLSFVIDIVLLLLCSVAFEFIDDLILGGFVPGVVELIYVAIWFIFLFGYFPIQLMLFSRTVGMRVMKLKVVRLDGAPLRVFDAISRFCFGLLDFAAFGGLVALILMKYRSESIADIGSKTKIIEM